MTKIFFAVPLSRLLPKYLPMTKEERTLMKSKKPMAILKK